MPLGLTTVGQERHGLRDIGNDSINGCKRLRC